MLTLSPPLLIVIGILTTAVAQVLLKKASAFDVRTSAWIIWMGLSAASYAVSFVAYSRILKYFALNKVYPAMTVAQIIVITLVRPVDGGSGRRPAVARAAVRGRGDLSHPGLRILALVPRPAGTGFVASAGPTPATAPARLR